ncbi:MAG: prefoldin subunit alpha [Thermoplasmata archaeon]
MSSPTPASLEERAQEEMARLDAYRSQLNAMLQQHQMLQSSRLDHERAQRSLDGIERAEAGREILIPLGGETYVRGTVQRGTPVLIGIGSGVTAELPREQVAETLAQRITRIDSAARELEGQIRTLEDRIQWLTQRLDALARGEPVPSGTADTDVGGD